MRLRSLLFVPGDRSDRMAKALASGADAVILDLEDSVAPEAKDAAREAVGTFLGRRGELSLFVRINPLSSGLAEQDLEAVASAPPDGIVLPKAEGAVGVEALIALLDVTFSARVPVLPIATETPAAVFLMGNFRAVADRLCGLTWGAEDLSAAVGAVTAREPDGRYTPPYELVRSLALFGAQAAGVPAIETVFPDFRDLDGLRSYCERAARDGFTGMMAIHPAQVAVINAAFTPSAEAIAHAQAVVAAFDAEPRAGVTSLDGRMIDAPHLAQARRILERAGLLE